MGVKVEDWLRMRMNLVITPVFLNLIFIIREKGDFGKMVRVWKGSARRPSPNGKLPAAWFFTGGN